MTTDRDKTVARRLTIHCGVQKTASTSLHHFIRRNQRLLQPFLDVLTPVKGSQTRAMGRAAMQFSLDPSPKRKQNLINLITGVRDQLVGGVTPVLISHENLPGAMLGKGGVTTLYPRLEEIIDLLNTYFAPFVPDYVFCTRQMPSWKNSVYNQAVKTDHYPHSRSVFDADTQNCGTWDDLAHRMQALVGAPRARFFRIEDETDPHRPGLQILRHAGLDDDVIATLTAMDRHSNPSLNAGALEFQRLVNTLKLEKSARRKVSELVRVNQPLFASGAQTV